MNIEQLISELQGKALHVTEKQTFVRVGQRKPFRFLDVQKAEWDTLTDREQQLRLAAIIDTFNV